MAQMNDSPHAWSPQAWRPLITEYIATHPDRPLKARGLARELDLPGEHYAHFRELIRDMLAANELLLGPGRRLEVPASKGLLVGVFRATRRGFGFLQIPEQPDIFVPEEHTGGALEGDTVAARMLRQRRRDEPAAAQVVRIVERALLRWVGVLEQLGRRWIVRPQGKAPAPVIEIGDPTAKAARPGDLVVVEPADQHLNSTLVHGVIVETLGQPSETQALMRATVRRHGIPDEFPLEVRRAAQNAAALFTPEAWEKREDLRNLLTITIDPRDARDFDDAISVELLGEGRYRLGVHIADVAHFVPEGGPIDREARLRGNSTYVPRFVVPMLPEVLSNGVCSLQPGVERLAKSAFINYNHKGEPGQTRFASSVIRSHARLTYEEASAALAGKPGSLERPVLELLRDAEDLARRIQRRRLADGMIVLNMPEVELQFDPEGRVRDSAAADNSFSHTLIEMFMVEANEAVCRYLVKRDLPHIRRVHPPPDPEPSSLTRQLSFLLGRELPDVLDRAAILDVLQQVRGKPEEPAVSFILLRSMSQASYSPALQGHFALASRHYTHFTSPIRRYADLAVHRLLDHCLQDQNGAPWTPPSVAELVILGKQISATERRSQQAERDAKNALLVQLMAGKLGETMEGLVTGVASFGVFVQLRPYLAEGLVRIGDLGNERWEYDKEASVLMGQRSGRVIALGQKVSVVVTAVDDTRQELLLTPDPKKPLGVPRSERPASRNARLEKRRAGRGRGKRLSSGKTRRRR